jgi:tungstate transport system substrate-binding protein
MRPKLTLFMAGIVVLAVIAAMSAGCTGTVPGNETPNATTNVTPTGAGGAGAGTNVLRIATTTSLDNTGLLAALEQMYENETDVDLQFIAQGTGQSIDTATRGDVDMIMVHAPALEQAFIDAGYGINPRCFAYNYFIIVGPEGDPAGIQGLSATDAFRQIYLAGSNGTADVAFVSRGDNSGTHTKEKELWDLAGYNYTNDIQGSESWYLESGKGMGDTLVLANEKNGYTLSDEGTYLAFKSQLNLVPLVNESPELLNRYSAIAVNPEKYPDTNIKGADEFINWLITNDTKEFIGNYGVEEYGQPLFTPLYAPECTQPPFNCTCSEQIPIPA